MWSALRLWISHILLLATLMLTFVHKVATLSSLFTSQSSYRILRPRGIQSGIQSTTPCGTEFHCCTTFSASEIQLCSVWRQTPNRRHPLWALELSIHLHSNSWTKPTTSFQRSGWKRLSKHKKAIYFSLCIKVTIQKLYIKHLEITFKQSFFYYPTFMRIDKN